MIIECKTSNILDLSTQEYTINQISDVIYSQHLHNDINFIYLGKQEYQPIWKLQNSLHQAVKDNVIPSIVLYLEHPHVYTFGKNANTNLLLSTKPNNTEVVQIDRGGQVTYHGPGQLVGYPILDLHGYRKSVSWYMRTLERVIINVLKQLGIESMRKDDFPGVWIGDDKICAMGVRLSKWVTMHGFALNLNTDMEYYDGMIPCGIFHYGITTLNQQGINVTIETLLDFVISSFDSLFDGEIDEV